MALIKGKICYRIPKGTQVWLVIDDCHSPMITERAALYHDEDIRMRSSGEYHFTLPSNDRRAEWLIVRKEHVRVTNSYSQPYPPPYRG
jgi:hypothetical protein